MTKPKSMKIMKYFSSKVLLACLMLSLPYGVFAQMQPLVVDEIIAKVDNYVVLRSDLEFAYQQSVGEKVQRQRCEIFQDLVINKILMAKSEIDSILVEPLRIEQELDGRMNYFVQQFGSEQKMEEVLGKSTLQLKDELRDQIAEQLTVQKMMGEITKEIDVTPEQVRRYYNRIPKDSIPFFSAEVEVGVIVLTPKISRSEKEKSRNFLLGIKDRIVKGEDFAALARKYSEDYGSAQQGGDLDWHGRGELVPEFEAVALKLEPGQISDPVESEFGFHLIQLLERRGNRFHARHILVRPKSSSYDIAAAEHLLDSIRLLISLDSMSFAQAAQKFSEDQRTKGNGGMLTDPATNGTFIATENLDPSLFFTVDTMKVGNITKPLRYRMEDGKNAVRLVYYRSHKAPHYANLKDDFERIKALTMNEQRQAKLKEWLRIAKRDVYIYIDPQYNNCNIINQL